MSNKTSNWYAVKRACFEFFMAGNDGGMTVRQIAEAANISPAVVRNTVKAMFDADGWREIEPCECITSYQRRVDGYRVTRAYIRDVLKIASS